MMNSRKKYNGQALAIVLIVLVIAVIIGMAVISRVFNDRVQVDDERSSAESVEVADTALDAVKNISLDDLATAASATSFCTAGYTNYNFVENGCTAKTISEYSAFLGNIPNFDKDPYIKSIETDLNEQCNYATNPNGTGFKVVFDNIDPEDTIDIQQDEVFAIMTKGVTPPTPNDGIGACNLNVKVSPQGTRPAGVVVSKIYTTMSGTDISSYREYEDQNIQPYCLGNNCNTGGGNFGDWNGWQYNSGTLPSVPIRPTNTERLYELRIRAINSPLAVSYSYSPSGCIEQDDLVRVQAIVNCNGNSRGKEFVLTGDEWAPGIFDYVLYNGQGELRNL
jgi:type II secretory pathway pseudopilin PulG